eukprot:m51a1_g12779 hypothetical protein (399) ;mRNA; f:700-2333
MVPTAVKARLGLSDDEIAALLLLYHEHPADTAGPAGRLETPLATLNRALESRSLEELRRCRSLLFLVLAAVRRLPRVEGVVCRVWASVDPRGCQRGAVVTWRGIGTASPDLGVARGVGAGKTVYVVSNGWGYDMRPLNLVREHESIITEPESEFVVTAVQEGPPLVARMVLQTGPLLLGGALPPRCPLPSLSKSPDRNVVQCVECGKLVQADVGVPVHRKECAMRVVCCGVCMYSIRYALWDKHSQYCNACGPCPLCAKEIDDNLVVHLFETHRKELDERGWFRGSALPPAASAEPSSTKPTGNCLRCTDCGTLVAESETAAHRRSCQMRRVSCSQCGYSMRYLLWASHSQYCNAVGTCPLCKKDEQDNMYVHLLQAHFQELLQRRFFQGVEPPTKPK